MMEQWRNQPAGRATATAATACSRGGARRAAGRLPARHPARGPVLSVAGGEGRSRIVLRALLAGLLLFGGLATLLSGRHPTAFLRPLGGVALVIAAIVVVFGPWWLRIARDLVLERQARARAEERADMAARVHDSVLQTLALIQRRSDDPQRVIQPAPPPDGEPPHGGFPDPRPA